MKNTDILPADRPGNQLTVATNKNSTAFCLNILQHQISFDNLVEIVQWHLKHQPEREVLIFLAKGERESGRLNYASLDKKARAIATRLQQNQPTGERALLVFHNGLDFITAFFGCLYAGVCAVPVYPPQNRQAYLQRLEMIASDCGASYMLGTADYLGKVSGKLSELTSLNNTAKIAVDTLTVDADDYIPQPLNRQSLAFLQYTSGSTSAPKGVMVSHGNLINNIASMQHCFSHDQNSVIVSWLPMFHDMGLIGSVLQPICIGAKCIAMAPSAFLQKPMCWLNAISKYNATTAYAPNFAYELCTSRARSEDIKRLDLSSWTMALNGAEPIKPQTLEDFKTTFAASGFIANAIYPGYGLAEATLFVSGAPRLSATEYLDIAVDDFEQKAQIRPINDNSPSRRLVSSGIPSPYNEVVIVNPDTHEQCEHNQVGEIWVHGDSVARGYWQNQPKTIETFHAKIAGQGDKRYMRTGDLGFLYNRHLFVCGRIKEVIIIRGANYYPQNIEGSLQSQINGLKPSGGAAFSVEHQGEEQLVVVQEVERTWLKKIEPELLVQQARHIISREYGLSLYALVLIRPMTLAKTSSGKIQRAKVRQQFIADELTEVAKFTQASPPQSSQAVQSTASQPGLDKAVADLVFMLQMVLAAKAGLSPQHIDIDQPITNSGLDSLALNELIGTLDNICGVRLALGPLLQADSLIDICQLIVDARVNNPVAATVPAATTPAPGITDNAPFELSINQLQMWLLYQKDPQSSAYHVPFCLRGQFDVGRLRQALVSLLQSHPLLRSKIGLRSKIEFAAGQQQWQQTINAIPQTVLLEHDLGQRNETGVNAHIIAAAKSLCSQSSRPVRHCLLATETGH